MKRYVLLSLLLFTGTLLQAQQQFNISFQHEGHTVYGTFGRPAAPGRYPLVIIVPGTGANDRHGTFTMSGSNAQCLYPSLLGQQLQPYRGLADALVDSGFAVLRYDKLEYTYPAAALSPLTFRKLWLPAESAIDYAKTRYDVDTARIILLGHSEGSTIIPYIARNRTDVHALASLAGPRTPLDTLLANQLVNIAQTCNGNVPLAQAQGAQIVSYFEMVRNHGWNATTPALFGVPAPVWNTYIGMADSVAINYRMAGMRTLFVGLEEDINVPVSELQRFGQELGPLADYYTLPGLNHYLTSAVSPVVSEALTDTIVYWLQQQVTGSGEAVQQPVSLLNVSVDDNELHARSEHEPVQELVLFDLSGRKLAACAGQNTYHLTLQTGHLPCGIYVYQATTAGKVLKQKIVLW